jgi:type 1 glutamine amidotransferase
MKKLFITGLLLSCVIWTANTSGQSKNDPLRVLVTVGNHDFEEPLFWAMLDALPGIEYTTLDLHEAMTACDHLTIVNGKPVYDCKLPPAASTLAPGLAEKFDVVLRYDMLDPWPAAQQQLFQDLLNTEPGIGFLSLHHNIAAHSQWPEWKKIIGGKYVFEDEIIDRKQYRQTITSGIEKPIDMRIKVVDDKHPITSGVSDFDSLDELYNNIYLADDIHVLLTTDPPDGDRRYAHDGGFDPAMAWTTSYGASRIFYLRIGHHSDAWATPEFHKIITQGLRWAACGSNKNLC